LQALDEFADYVVMLGFGVELPAAGDFADFDAAVVGLIGGSELFERGAGLGFFDA
jgi:hypothetical protein